MARGESISAIRGTFVCSEEHVLQQIELNKQKPPGPETDEERAFLLRKLEKMRAKRSNDINRPVSG